MRLVGFEFIKVWGRRGFLASVCTLMMVNLFLLWYTNLPEGEEPALSAYQAFQVSIAGMTEAEKGEYVSDFKETMDGIRFVEQVLMLRGISGEMGEALAAQALAEAPGVFEAYLDLYQSGEYIRFTDSLWQEGRLADELYEEWKSCAGYEEYLQSVQEQKSTLGSIGIFGGGQKDSFSARNVEKSARDYEKLTGENLRWMPQKAVAGSMESLWTDVLLLLGTAFFVGHLILEEKDKGLFYITRSTRNGILPDIWARLAALLANCQALAGLLYGINLLFYGRAAGFGDLSAGLQSLAAYRESCLEITIWQYLILSIVTKGLVLFGFGAVLMALCILTSRPFLPYIAGGVWYGCSHWLYTAIPAASSGALFKYMNLAGNLRTENLYGAYLNLNVFGQPVSRMRLTLGLLAVTILTGVSFCLLLYSKGERFELQKRHRGGLLPFRPTDSLFYHESIKILVMNRAIVVLLLFGILMGGRNLSRQYNLSVQEQYYQNLMLQLEGGLTEEKEALVLAEEDRYRQAFQEIERIDEMVSRGEIGETAGEDMKSRWYAVTAFYPAFSRAWQQYERICESGGEFLYDTGYLYLLGALGEGFRIDFLLLSCAMVLSFGGAAAMEDEKGTWNLLGATLRGKRKIAADKIAVCVLWAALLSLVPFFTRFASTAHVFPVRNLLFSATDIGLCQHFPAWLSVGGMLALLAFSQMLVCAAAAFFVLLVSWWRKNSLQAYLFAAVLLLLPLVLGVLGLSFADSFSLYPLYAWTA